MSLGAEMEDEQRIRHGAEVLHEVVDRGTVGQVGEVHVQPLSQGGDVVESPTRRGAGEGVDVRAELDQRLGQVRADEPVRPRDENGPARVDGAELPVELLEPIGAPGRVVCFDR